MKPSADGVDIHKWERVVMGSVREQDENAFLDRIDPKARARKPIVPKAFRRHLSSGRGIFG